MIKLIQYLKNHKFLNLIEFSGNDETNTIENCKCQ